MIVSLFFMLMLNAPTATPLVSLQQISPEIHQDLRYATADNFTHAVVYDFNSCYLRPAVAVALAKVQVRAKQETYSLKVWDCYRPMKAQERFWELVPDPRYVSPPGKGGRHTRGTAVDLTLVDEKGQEVIMPSHFDDFSERAHRRVAGRKGSAENNHRKLEAWMQAEGFVGLSTEWWHYDFKGWEAYPPVEVDVRSLQSSESEKH